MQKVETLSSSHILFAHFFLMIWGMIVNTDSQLYKIKDHLEDTHIRLSTFG